MQRQFSRRLKMKTNYKKRLGMLRSDKTRLYVRRSLNRIHIQVIQYNEKGDHTIIEKSSKDLSKFGWKGHGGNLSAAYLTGLLVGHDALKKGIKEMILDIGLQRSVKGNALYSACKGVVDAGVSIPLGEAILPDEKRIKGRHIAEYAKQLKGSNAYNCQFALYLKNGIVPENFVSHFEEVKNNIVHGDK